MFARLLPMLALLLVATSAVAGAAQAASPPSAKPWEVEDSPPANPPSAKAWQQQDRPPQNSPSAKSWQMEHRPPGFADEIKPKDCEAQVRRQRLQLEVGLASMEQDPDLNGRALNCFVKLWAALSRDELRHRPVRQGNATRSDLVGAMLSMLSIDSPTFFHVMNKELATAQEWLWDLSDRGTIIIEGNQTCPFDYQRNNLLEIVEGTSVSPDEEPLRERTLARLREVKCRMFN